MASGIETINQQRAEIVARIISDIEEGGLSWAEPWASHLSQRNGVTGHVYRGGNRIHLAFVSMARGYSDHRWATWKQIEAAGWKVKKGAKSAAIEKWKSMASVTEGEDGEVSVRRWPKLVGCWRVFNFSDIEGAPAPDGAAAGEWADAGTACVSSALIASSRCPVLESASVECAAYSPLLDSIRIPARRQFIDGEYFTRTLLHEMAHSTGHPSALGRDLSGRFGSAGYALEELVAELGAAFCAVELGLGAGTAGEEHGRQHAAYVESWLSALRDDPGALFAAASKADEAAAFIMERLAAMPSEEAA